jgi:6-pyruvoyltetrahydropterin/6-carboxytetrahydropterin synthase
MKATISKEFKFEAAHVLPNHDGKCSRLHGHNYRAVIYVDGEIKPADGSRDEGMVMDFADVKLGWEGIRGSLDHQFLNETLPIPVTTAENIAAWILERLPFASAVTVYETDDCWAMVER